MIVCMCLNMFACWHVICWFNMLDTLLPASLVRVHAGSWQG